MGTIAGLGTTVVARAAAGMGLAYGLEAGLVAGIGAALGVGFGVALTYAATWDASLAFAQLAIGQRTPFRLMQFMEDARQRSVLRAVGPIYQFRHARLQDRLADRAKTAGRPETPATQPQALPQENSGQPPQDDHLRRLRWVWAAAGLIALSLAVVVFTTPFHVTGVEITQQPKAGCQVDVTGRISTNGALGTIWYQWVFQPRTAPQPLKPVGHRAACCVRDRRRPRPRPRHRVTDGHSGSPASGPGHRLNHCRAQVLTNACHRAVRFIPAFARRPARFRGRREAELSCPGGRFPGTPSWRQPSPNSAAMTVR